MGYGPGLGFGGFGHFVGVIVGGLLSFFLFLVAVALIFLLVRFLLVATRAAHLYIAKNSPPAPRSATPGGSAGAAYAPRTTAVATSPAAVAKPDTKPRTPRPPTA